MDKTQMMNKKILGYLEKNPNTSVKDIATFVDLSDKTVRTKLNEIDLLLGENGFGFIDKVPSKGVSLSLNPDTLNEFHHYIESQEVPIFNKLEDQLTLLLLQQALDNYVTQNELALPLFVTAPTLRNAITEIEEWFQDRKLTIETIRGKGLTIIGEEYNKRSAIRDAIIAQETEDKMCATLHLFAKGISIEEISIVIRDTEKDWKIKFSKESFFKILIMLILALSRFSKPLKIDRTEKLENIYLNEYNFVETLFQRLSDRGYKNLGKLDKDIIALEFLGSNKLRWKDSVELRHIHTTYDRELSEFVERIIDSISSVLMVPLQADFILQEELKNHLRSAIFRLKYGQKNQTEMTSELKQIYKSVYLAVWSTSQLFEEYFDVQLTESEITYIVLYIEAAILRVQNKTKAVLVTSLGRSHSLYTVEMIKKNIPEIDEITIIREEELKEKKFKNTFVITNTPLEQECEAVYVSYVPTSRELDQIRSRLGKEKVRILNSSVISETAKPLLEPQLVFMDQTFDNKERILKFLTKEMERKGFVSKAFYESVWNRELKTTTCIGNKAAIPHGKMQEVFEPKVAIMVLQEPIRWFDDEFVDTIFLLATKMNTTAEIRQTKHFYRDLINLTENEKQMKNFKSCKTNVAGFNYLIRRV